ncbi:MAG TPA: hypothetical protein V6C97_26760 [Oculatellaceae cyanobacterium]
MNYTYQGQTLINRFHVVAASGGAPDASDCLALAQEFDAWRIANLRALQSASLQCVRVDAINLSAIPPGTGVQASWYPTATPGGSDIGVPLPGNVAFVVTLRTAKGGRRYRGRSYQGGLTNGMLLSPNVMTAAKVNAFVAAYTALVNRLVTNTRFRLGVQSKMADIPYPAWPIDPWMHVIEPVTAITADSNIDSQRRRLNGRGI